MLISTLPNILNFTSFSSSPAGDSSARLKMKRFNGKRTNWQVFINCDSAICLNSKVSDIDKIKYLKSVLEGPASAANVGINKEQHSKGAAGTKVGK